MNHNSLLREEGEKRERRGWTNLLTLELIEQNESCTEMKRDCKAKGKESLTRTEERGDERRVRRGETDGGAARRHKYVRVFGASGGGALKAR